MTELRPLASRRHTVADIGAVQELYHSQGWTVTGSGKLTQAAHRI